MILIITEEADHSTSTVIDWLLFYKIKFIRINENDSFNFKFSKNEIFLFNEELSFCLSEIKGVWFRRGQLKFRLNKINDKTLNNFQLDEFEKVKEYIYHKLSKLPSLNSIDKYDVNKLIVSDIAKKHGLVTPNEYLISRSQYLFELNNEKKYITKSITGSTILDFEDNVIIAYTTKLDEQKKIPNVFFPSLIQEYIEKKYELRVFYLNGHFYSMAIFSQKDETTKVDFRNYNRTKPNRTVSYKLPKQIENSLNEIMVELGMNSGSIDLIVTNDDNFVFLEVNPVGQFGMVSKPCNYYLHKKIAEYFIL